MKDAGIMQQEYRRIFCSNLDRFIDIYTKQRQIVERRCTYSSLKFGGCTREDKTRYGMLNEFVYVLHLIKGDVLHDFDQLQEEEK